MNDLLDRLLEQARGRLSDRKFRLFACACAREIWQHLDDERSRQTIEVAERFADGEATPEELVTTRDAAWVAARKAMRDAPPGAARYATWVAARYAAWTASRNAGRDTAWDAAGDAAWNATRVASGDALARQKQTMLFACISRPIPTQRFWSTSVQGLARTIYQERDWQLMLLLADALDELGEDEAAAHCREPVHARGCWVIDYILGKQ